MCELRGTSTCSKSCSMMNHITLSLNSSSRNSNNNNETETRSNDNNRTNNNYVDMNNNAISPCRTMRDNEPTQRKHDDFTSASNDQRKRRKEPNATSTSVHLMKKLKWTIALALCISLMPRIQCQYGSAEGSLVGAQNWDRPGGMPKITRLEVMCGAQHMEVHLAFDSPFHGLVASKGMYGHDGCVYVAPRTGQTNFVFNIYYDKCGTKPDNHGKFFENTVVVQYDEELIEAWDEAKRLRCEWFNDYEKTATKTNPMVISDLDIVELNFHGDNVDCWMEIQEGKGPWAPPLNGIVPLGSPLTMVVAVKDPTGEFDMRVKACEASDGHGGHVLPLSDPDGCIMRPKLLSKFSKIKLDDGRATVLTYAHINAFKFPDMLNVHLRCTVEICRHGCPNHCSTKYNLPQEQHNKQAHPIFNGIPHGPEVLGYESKKNEQSVVPNEVQQKQVQAEIPEQPRPAPPPQSEKEPSVSMHAPQPLPPNHPRPFMIPPAHQRIPGPPPPPQRNPLHPGMRRPPPHMGKFPNPQRRPPFPSGYQPNRQGLPAAPENNPAREIKDEAKEAQQEMLMEAQAESLKSEPLTSMERDSGSVEPSKVPSPRNLRVRRSVSSNSDVIGIQGAFKVISQADLNFVLNSNSSQNTMTPPSPVFSGKISEDAVYGICLPRIGFSIVFFGLGLATLVAILIAGFLAYAHYRAILYKKSGFKGQGTTAVHTHSIANPGARLNNNATTHTSQNVLPVPMVILRKMW